MFNFNLTPAYCLFNGIGIVKQNGSEILFLVENPDDLVLQSRIKRAFLNYLEGLLKMTDCPKEYKNEAEIKFIKGNREELRRCVSGLYKVSEKSEDGLVDLLNHQEKKEAAAVILLDSILHVAREKKATDIHIEKNCIKMRINGRLEKYLELQKDRYGELIQRIKLLSGMNVIERHKSQDGRFVYGNSNPVFVRVSSVPVVGKNYLGEESLVMRLLDTSRIPLRLNLLGFSENQLEVLKGMSFIKNGLILVCGPTGAGKSTTVASMLVELEDAYKGKIKIISLEEPPEYVVPGVSQIQIDENGENTFEESLNHVFRQDPDVIMIGEIRDEKSAAAALRASLTGHLVFATLHTGGAGEALLRLENLGLNRKLLSSVVRAIICQELNYREDGIELCADIAIPTVKFSKSVREEMSEEELDGLFYHLTNFSDVLQETLKGLKQGLMRYRKIWNGGLFDQKIHKRIG